MDACGAIGGQKTWRARASAPVSCPRRPLLRTLPHMMWNDPKRTLPMASYAKPEPRRASTDRRTDERRATVGERRLAAKRVLQALLRF
jgi:hypothetical protein